MFVKRIDMLDYLRGFALVGIIFINIYQMVPYVPVPPEYGFWSRLDQGLLTFVNDAVHGRFYTIFSFLIGLGFLSVRFPGPGQRGEGERAVRAQAAGFARVRPCASSVSTGRSFADLRAFRIFAASALPAETGRQFVDRRAFPAFGLLARTDRDQPGDVPVRVVGRAKQNF
jgi:hypothetical protein